MNIEELKNQLKNSINEISVYDFNSYTSIELYYKIANKVNEIIKELERHEILVSDEIIKQNNVLQEMLDVGLHDEVVNKINNMVNDGTMDLIINQNVLQDLNSQIKDIENNKADKNTTLNIQQQVNNLVLGAVGDGNNAEVIQARGNFDTLNDRLITTDKYIDFLHKNINKEISFTVENGGLASGGNFDNENTLKYRARTKEMLYANDSTKIIRLNNEYLFSVITYDGEIYDGIDVGWLDVDDYTVTTNKFFRLHFKKANGSEITDLDTLFNAFKIIHIGGFTNKLKEDTNKLKEDLKVTHCLNTDDFVIGGITAGEDTMVNNRVRTKEKLYVKKDKVITFKNNNDNTIFYGVNVYDENGNYNGVDYGWMNKSKFIMPQDGYVKIVLRFGDNREITTDNKDALVNDTITMPRTIQEVNDSINDLKSEIDKIDKSKYEAISSILVEYGRIKGASYVFVRIPKTLNNGKIITPRVKLTSADGSISGTKRSTLNYARDNDSIFTVNAGLFDMSTYEPVGQLIIDGVSLINTPMTDDNGIPISDSECYPLAIDSNGKFTTYPRNVDTSTMLNDGIQYAVTSWGKLVDNFQICTDDINSEIVHQGKYIRQSIGQYQNGDYCVCTVDMTRGSVTNEAGLSYEELAQIFVDKGVKFAYSLDGGGSAETVIGKRQLNPIYEGDSGRKVPTVIEFCII